VAVAAIKESDGRDTSRQEPVWLGWGLSYFVRPAVASGASLSQSVSLGYYKE
jgi:hypothetical protein